MQYCPSKYILCTDFSKMHTFFKVICSSFFQCVIECDIANRRSLVWVTRGSLVARRYTYAPPRCRTSQYRWTFIHLSVSLCNDLADPEFDGVGLAENAFSIVKPALSLL